MRTGSTGGTCALICVLLHLQLKTLKVRRINITFVPAVTLLLYLHMSIACFQWKLHWIQSDHKEFTTTVWSEFTHGTFMFTYYYEWVSHFIRFRDILCWNNTYNYWCREWFFLEFELLDASHIVLTVWAAAVTHPQILPGIKSHKLLQCLGFINGLMSWEHKILERLEDWLKVSIIRLSSSTVSSKVSVVGAVHGAEML